MHTRRPRATGGMARGPNRVDRVARREGSGPSVESGPGEDMVDEICRALGHPAATVARTKASAFARERDQPIGTAARTAELGKPMGKHAAAHESLKLGLNEQGGATLVVTSVVHPLHPVAPTSTPAPPHRSSSAQDIESRRSLRWHRRVASLPTGVVLTTSRIAQSSVCVHQQARDFGAPPRRPVSRSR